MHERISVGFIMTVVLLFTTSVAHATHLSRQKCLSGRAKAQGTYQNCVQNGVERDSNVYLATCLKKYIAAWTPLHKLTGTTCALARWVDNGNGTVTDNFTGLIWQKTDDAGGVTDKDNYYAWTSGDADQTDEDGTVFTEFLRTLNAGDGFGGANDWRLPTLAELQTIVLPYPCGTIPCIDPVFGPTNAVAYWSSTTAANSPSDAFSVNVFDGDVSSDTKTDTFFVRAVRGGS